MQKMGTNDRRFESRCLCADVVRVDWLSGEDDFVSEEALLEDISALGACIQVEAPIPPGCTISLALGAKSLTGYVSYCVFREYGYFVGIQFSEESHWSSDVFLPQHMTDLQELVREACLVREAPN